MKVSILVPIYGVEKFIKKCAVSLLEQTYEDIEYVFVNDCTKDRSIEILQEVVADYPERRECVKIVEHEKNRGLSAARNTALDCAEGDYLMHVDSDDFLKRNAVELLVAKAINSKADVVVCASNLVYENKVIYTPCHVPDNKEKYLEGLLYKSIAPSMWGKLFRTRFYRDSGIRSIEGLNHGEDYATLPRLIYHADKIVTVDSALYNYVQYNQEAYTKNITRKSIDDMVRADAVLSDFFMSLSQADKYVELLNVAKLRTKLALLKMSRMAVYRDIISLYPEISSKYSASLSFSDRMLFYFVHHGLYRIAYCYAKLGLWVKRKMVNR